MSRKVNKLIIGSKDKCDFPEFELFDLACKIDTGADSSAIHCQKIKVIENHLGEQLISFNLLDPSHKKYNNVEFRTKDFEQKKIKSSNGIASFRYVIKTKVCLFGQEFITDFTLADRENMKFPVLLGKKLLRGRFMVDVSLIDLSYKQKISRNTSSPFNH